MNPKFVRERGLRTTTTPTRPSTSSQVVWTNYQTRSCKHTYLSVSLLTHLSTYLPPKIYRDTIRRVYTGTRWCVYTYFRARAADGHIMRENVKRQQLARPPAGRLVPGGRQLPDGKTPALPFLLDRPGPVSRVAQEEPTPVSLFLLSLPLSASFSLAFSFLPCSSSSSPFVLPGGRVRKAYSTREMEDTTLLLRPGRRDVSSHVDRMRVPCRAMSCRAKLSRERAGAAFLLRHLPLSLL